MKWIGKVLREVVNVLFSITIALFLLLVIKDYVAQPFQVEGQSMDLTLKEGNQMLLFKSTSIERFDIIVFPDPMGSGKTYIKRLIGMPGDTIEMKDDILYLNGIALDEPYLESLKSLSENSPFTENFTLRSIIGFDIIPEGYYFVMGDNRPYSGDSRQFGLVPIETVQGNSTWIYWPLEAFGKVTTYQLDDSGQMIIEK